MLSAVIDLHTHSTASDGRSTPAELMVEAARAGIDVLGLTDHDTIAGWEEAAGQVEATGVTLVRGMELSAKIDGISVHILGYLFDPDDERLTAHVARMLAERRDRAVQMVARLARDVPVTWEAVEAHAEDLPFDYEPYVDAAGHAYAFGYGMGWDGIIEDDRTRRYRP